MKESLYEFYIQNMVVIVMIILGLCYIALLIIKLLDYLKESKKIKSSRKHVKYGCVTTIDLGTPLPVFETEKWLSSMIIIELMDGYHVIEHLENKLKGTFQLKPVYIPVKSMDLKACETFIMNQRKRGGVYIE